MEENTNMLVINKLSKMTDDIIYSIILTKEKDNSNNFLSFMHAHALELSAKSACLKLDIDFYKIGNGHNLMTIYELISKINPEIKKFLPNEEAFNRYKEVWVPSEPILKENKNISYLPEPKKLYMWELAYLIDNVINLKYGFDKKNKYVSIINLGYKGYNPSFMNLIKTTRDIYRNKELDERLKSKIFITFGITEESEKLITKIISS